MTRQEFQIKVADLIEIVDLYGYEFLTMDEETEISDTLNGIMDTLRVMR